MRIAVLTSSRADYSIYKPLLEQIKKQESDWVLELIVFGTHLSEKYGYTANAIVQDGFTIAHKVETMPSGDSPAAIAYAMGTTIQKFSEVWRDSRYDLVFALGDRYEMFAAVAASLPFNIQVAHIHGGETTLGAIDNAFRHSISHMAKYHFVSSEAYKVRLAEILGHTENSYNVGALSFDNLSGLQLFTKEEFKERYKIDLNNPTILITFHPETVSYDKNKGYADELIDTLREISGYQYLITMPNADTTGLAIREKLIDFSKANKNVFLYENLGTVGYLSAMKHCSFLVGNTSSGFIEASYFPKWVINLGSRQKGRITTPNIIQVPFHKKEILEAINKIKASGEPERVDIYGDGLAAGKIVKIIKENS